MIYFDNAASAPLCDEAKAALIAETELFANPSSLHRPGFEAEGRLKHARAQLARTLGADEEEIFFTSGGTEADNLALLGVRKGSHIVASDSEHPAVSECLKALEGLGCTVSTLSTRGGALDLTQASAVITEKTAMVACMHTNNETGAVYDVASLARIAKAKNPRCLVFSDGVQGYLKSAFTPASLGLDLMSLSAHKIGGPKGVGALWVRRGVHLAPRALGGSQEKGLRSGTENLPGIVAFGAAAQARFARLSENIETMRAVRQTALNELEGVDGVAFNLPADPAPHILSLRVKGFRSEVLLHTLSERDIFVSSGSACSSKKGKSPVLRAFGLSSEEADCTVRLSFSPFNTTDEAKTFCEVLKSILKSGR